MSQEILNAAIMQLRSKALEAYGVIKDMYQRPSQEGDADKIATLSLRLAQLEGGMITLQQYAPEIIASSVVPEVESETSEDPAPPLASDENVPDSGAPITEEDLAARSPTYRRSQKRNKKDKS